MARILLVEDHRSFRRALALVLGREPDLEVVAQAGSVAEARTKMEEAEALDVAVLDLGLPDGDGVELVEEVRAASPGTAILVLTVDINPKNRERARSAGADAVLGKESAIGEIVGAVKRAITERRKPGP